MTTLAEQFGHTVGKEVTRDGKGIATRQRVGIELEFERCNDEVRVPFGGSLLWEFKPDGSLRNGGIEFVLRNPYGGLYLDKALHQLQLQFFSALW